MDRGCHVWSPPAFRLLIFNHRSQCPHLWMDKCWFLGKGFIFLLYFLFFMFRLFFKEYFTLLSSQMCLAQRELLTEEKCIFILKLSVMKF